MNLLDGEAGGHRFQRIPPTERRGGRVHTSTVTVAVTDPELTAPDFDMSDVEVQWFSGTGAGGQHRNKHQNSCRLIHRPTGVVESRQGRHRDANLRDATEALQSRLQADAQARHDGAVAVTKAAQRGSGARGDKVRTYQQQNDRVTDHKTGRQSQFTRVMKGDFAGLWR